MMLRVQTYSRLELKAGVPVLLVAEARTDGGSAIDFAPARLQWLNPMSDEWETVEVARVPA